MPRLQGVFLNACDTLLLGEAIVLARPGLYVVVWEGPVTDTAAAIFGAAFYEAVGGDLAMDVGEAYDLAFKAYRDTADYHVVVANPDDKERLMAGLRRGTGLPRLLGGGGRGLSVAIDERFHVLTP